MKGHSSGDGNVNRIPMGIFLRIFDADLTVIQGDHNWVTHI